MSCRVCNSELNDSNWYPSNKRNCLYICKNCQKKKSQEQYHKIMIDPELKLDKNLRDRNYHEKHKTYFKIYLRNYMKKNSFKYRDRKKQKIEAMINDVRRPTFIPLGSECELCPEDDVKTEDLERHHPDYSYPEIFVTCCSQCHKWLRIHKI